MAPAKKGLRERLAAGEMVLAAEGYTWELERRGYLQGGTFIPEVVLEHPEVVRSLTEEFVHAGTDVVLAFCYYGHREKLKLVGRENDAEKLNIKALEIAREISDKHGLLMAGNICNSTTYDPKNPEAVAECKQMNKDQVEWAIKYGCDMLVAETYSDLGEALLAIEAAKTYGKGVPIVVSFATTSAGKTRDGYTYVDACKKAEAAGADVVGLNCSSGPETMVQFMKEIRAAVKIPVSCLPVAYRTTQKDKQFQSLMLPDGKRAFFEDLDHFLCSQREFETFGKIMKEIGVQYLGICCGNSSRHFRRLAESVGRTPPASRYRTDMSGHYLFGEKTKTEYQQELLKMATT